MRFLECTSCTAYLDWLFVSFWINRQRHKSNLGLSKLGYCPQPGTLLTLLPGDSKDHRDRRDYILLDET